MYKYSLLVVGFTCLYVFRIYGCGVFGIVRFMVLVFFWGVVRGSMCMRLKRCVCLSLLVLVKGSGSCGLLGYNL